MASEYRDRIEDLARRAREDREAAEVPTDPPAEDEALTYLREGLGPLVSLYVESRTGGKTTYFPPEEQELFDRALNDWLAAYATCYGHDVETDYTIRTAAELLIDTHDVQATARALTHVPARDAD